MADVPGKFYRATKVRTGVAPSSAGSIEGEVLPPVNPPGSSLNSVGLTMPSAFTVSNSPLTANGTIGVAGAGTVAQYIRGDGSLADFPESSGGGSSVSYYLNGSVDQGTIGGVAYKELSKVPILGAGTDFSINADGYIASFITDAGDPSLLEIPGGNWNFETYFSASSSGGTPTFYVELYKVSGTTATLIASSSSAPELIAFGTNLNPYFSTLAVPTTTLALTDRLSVRYYVTHSGRTITLHTENNHLCQIVTTFTTGITALNGLTAQVQNFAVGTTGTDFNIASATATHTFNLPTASATNRGALSSADWSTFNAKQNALTLTTTGTSGAATLVGATLNIPQYQAALTNPVTGTGSAGQVAYWSSSSAITGESNLFWDSTNDRLGIGTNTPQTGLHLFSTSPNIIIQNSSTSSVGNISRLFYRALLSSGNTAFIGFIDGVLDSTIQNTGHLEFYTYNNGIPDEGMRIFSGGNVHIGPSPSSNNGAKLQVSGTATIAGLLSVTGNISLIAGGVGSSFNRQISLGSGTAYNYQVRANGDDFQLIEAGSHVFLEYDYGGSLGAGTIRLYNNTVSTGSFTANSFTKIGGTSSQYLMADGSVSTLTNPITGSGNSGTIPVFTGSTTIGNSIIQSNSTQVNIVGNGSQLLFDSLGSTKDGGIQYVDDFELRIYNSRGTGSSIILGSSNLDFNTSSSGNPKLRITQTGAATFSSSVTASSFIRSGGTSSQYLMADGSVSTLSNPITGTGTTNYLPKFTGSTTIGNSQIIDNGTQVGIGLTPNASYGTLQIKSPSSVYSLDLVGRTAGLNGESQISFWNAAQSSVLAYITNTGSNLYLGTGANQPFTLSSGGNFIFGTTTDNGARLQVSGTAYISNTLTTDGSLVVRNTNISQASILRDAIVTNGTTIGILRFGARFNSTTYGTGADISTSAVGTWSSSNYGTNLVFSTVTQNTDVNTARMTILHNGNVGIGQVNPAARLHVEIPSESPASGNTGLLVRTGNGANDVFRWFDGATQLGVFKNSGNVGIGTPTPLTRLDCQSSGTGSVTETAAFRDNSTNGNALQIFNGNNESRIRAVYYGTPSDQNITFWTIQSNGSQGERMRITSGGFLKASNTGTYASSTGLYHEFITDRGDNLAYFWNTSANPYGPYVRFSGAAPNNGTNYYFYCDDTSAARFIVYSNGGISNYQANNTNLSDERTKKEISPLESYWDKFKAIEIVKFKYKDQTHDDFNIGVIAQQVEKVAPEFVDVDGWDNKTQGNEVLSQEEPIKSIYTADLHHATIKVLQEAMAKIEAMQKEIDTLKN